MNPVSLFSNFISIHAPREGSDKPLRAFELGVKISIHAPREGSDRLQRRLSDRAVRFQSTLPVKGATYSRIIDWNIGKISIHAPREGSDHINNHTVMLFKDFNPRSP